MKPWLPAGARGNETLAWLFERDTCSCAIKLNAEESHNDDEYESADNVAGSADDNDADDVHVSGPSLRQLGCRFGSLNPRTSTRHPRPKQGGEQVRWVRGANV